MDSVAKRIVISGYYGFGNSGDEAVLQSIIIALREQAKQNGIVIEPVVLSIRPEITEKMYGVRAVHRLKFSEIIKAIRASDGLISGGGSLLQDATGIATIPYYLGMITLAQWLGKPTFIYSQGIGPVHRSVFHPFIRSVFRKCKYVSVRDEESAQLLQQFGLNKNTIDIVPDPVMGLPLNEVSLTNSSKSLPVIGISVRFWNKDRSELDQLAASLDDLTSKRDVELRFLPFHLPSDEEASQYVISRMRANNSANVSIINDAIQPQQMLAQVSQCDVMVGMRLHALIYAASQYVPLLGISYDPKIDQFLNRLHMQAAASTDQFHAERMSAEILRLLDEREQWISSKRSLIDELKNKSQHPAQQIAALLRNKG